MKLNNYAILCAIQSENYEAALEILMEHFGLPDTARAGARHALATRPDFIIIRKDRSMNAICLRMNHANYFWSEYPVGKEFASSGTLSDVDCFIVQLRRHETR